MLERSKVVTRFPMLKNEASKESVLLLSHFRILLYGIFGQK